MVENRLVPYGAIRAGIIAYGIAAYTYFVPRLAPESSSFDPLSGIPQMLIGGLGVQALMFVGRRLVNRHDSPPGIDRRASPQILEVASLVGDGVTVLLFALATYGGILRLAFGQLEGG